ncbi:hypothetical protein [Rhodalgimonas zhirmunskyi]|uniref:Capsule polysaccharide biosynthesis protein n=1 Tax=Rhodalgimonas zhirmunskyi TaxID=2964767 RepID=A0AAJ1X5N2_9RHOB|nr:hypothetical protein [Rhodoalgimonas zhirmunskyi]MDQ2094324.1 hypothetical protein [Rhodoalgimonas zhirmunskyi]
MTLPSMMTFYLEPGLKESAEAGQHNFLSLIAQVGREAGLDIVIRGNSTGDLAEADPDREWAVVHMEPPPHARAVSLRRAYAYPFWSIERSEKRWEFDVARALFDADAVDGAKAARFVARWQKRLFGDWPVDGPRGHVYVPLQGRLGERRSFQTHAPLEMVHLLLDLERERPIAIGLHPKESYSALEIDALEKLEIKHPRVSVEMGGMERLLPGADYVVTENSGAGFFGLFHEKPLVLFAGVDFHHIAARVSEIGAKRAIKGAPAMRPDFARYLYWFWQERAINAGRPEAKTRIAERLRGFGWPV